MHSQRGRVVESMVEDEAEVNHDSFVRNKVRSMDIEAQVGAMAQVDISQVILDDHSGLDPKKVQHFFGDLKVGSILNTPSKIPWSAQQYRKAVMLIQDVVKKTNGTPVIWGLDSVHGANYVHGSRITPQPINLAASFDDSLSYQAGQWASTDTRRAGIPWLFSPLLGLAWHPNWSRVYETFGEDPVLVGRMAKAMVQGIQDPNPKTNFTPSLAAACAKHWIGYPMTRNGHDRSPSWIPRRHLMQYFLPPWTQVLQGDQQALTVMESYTETDGVPNVANREHLSKLLRHRLGYVDGMLVTDFSEIYNLESWHGTAQDRPHAVQRSFTDSSVDMSMVPNDVDEYVSEMIKLVKSSGQAAVHSLEEHVRRVILLKKKLGMFDEMVEELPEDYTRPTDAELKEAKNMTQQTIILASNERSEKVHQYYQRRKLNHITEGKTLPLKSDNDGGLSAKTFRVLVTGPTSDSLSYQSGGWTSKWQGIDPEETDKWFVYGKTVRQAAEAEPTWDVKYRCGVNILGRDCEDKNDRSLQDAPNVTEDEQSMCAIHDSHDEHEKNIVKRFKNWVGWDNRNSDSNDQGASYRSIGRAMDETCDQDLIIVCIGEENYAEKPGDIRSLRLPEGQYELVRALRARASEETRLVVVYFGGRPRLLDDIVELADSVVIGFLPGPLAGNAIIDLFQGRFSPSAKMPITYPKFEDGGGIPYLHEVSDQCTKDTKGPLPHWEYAPCEVQFPFGHGLSFAEFEYSNLKLDTKELVFSYNDKKDTVLIASVKVTNNGSYAGAETVMMFTFDLFRDTTPEHKRLRAYKKIWLESGASSVVKLSLKLSELRFIGPHDDSHYILQDGQQFRVGIGAHTDCRRDPDNNNMCTPPITIRTGNDYVGACEAACDVWMESGCMSFYGMSSSSCWKSCIAIRDQGKSDAFVQMNNDGWGWNYVACIESLVWGNRDTFYADDSQCWKMTSFCRDVTATERMDEFAHGPLPYEPGTRLAPATNPARTALLPLILAAISGSLIMTAFYFGIRGWFQRRRDGGTDPIRSNGDIQFSTISQDEREEELTL